MTKAHTYVKVCLHAEPLFILTTAVSDNADVLLRVSVGPAHLLGVWHAPLVFA